QIHSVQRIHQGDVAPLDELPNLLRILENGRPHADRSPPPALRCRVPRAANELMTPRHELGREPTEIDLRPADDVTDLVRKENAHPSFKVPQGHPARNVRRTRANPPERPSVRAEGEVDSVEQPGGALEPNPSGSDESRRDSRLGGSRVEAGAIHARTGRSRI